MPPPGLLMQAVLSPCNNDQDCAHGAYCVDGTCSTTHNYFCAHQVETATTFGCNSGKTPACNTPAQTCRDEWFECLPANPTTRLTWPALGDTCEDIVVTYEIVVEAISDDAPSAFCSKRHKGCAQGLDCTGPQRPSSDHCGPTAPGLDAKGRNYDCATGNPSTPSCPASDDPAWPQGLGDEADAALIAHAEAKVGKLCAAAGCQTTARCQPSDGTMGYTDGGLGIQGSSGIKDDSFIGHARVCTKSGPDVCNDKERPEATVGDEPCGQGAAVDDSRDALVPGRVSRREADIRCQCVTTGAN